MNVTCPSCSTVYRVDPAKVPEAGVRARCRVCAAVFPVTRTEADGSDLAATVKRPAVGDRLEPPTVRSPAIPDLAQTVKRPSYPGEVAQTAKRPSLPPDLLDTAERPSVETDPDQTARRPSFPPERAEPLPSPDFPEASLPTAAQSSPAPGVTRPSVAPPALPGTGRPTTPRGFPPPASPTARTSAMPPPAVRPAGSPSATPVARPAIPSAAAPAAPAVPARPAGRPINPFLSQDPAQKARRLARALISDLAVYYPDRRKEGLSHGTLKELFQEEITKSWEEYTEQVGKEMAESTTYFNDALNEILAGGQKLF